MSVVQLQPSRPLFVAFQGGAALGAFAEGAVEAICESNPKRPIVGATGTSSGALTATFFTEGYAKGGLPGAVARTKECWDGLSSYQKHEVGFWFDMTETWGSAAVAVARHTMDTAQRTGEYLANMADAQKKTVDLWFKMAGGLGGAWSPLRMPAAFAAATANQAIDTAYAPLTQHLHKPALSSSPILGFLKDMQDTGRGLDYSAIRKAENFLLIVNATHVPVGGDPWQATAKDERLFTNKDIAPMVLAASGSLVEFVPPAMVNKEPLRDGAYFSNPHLPMAAKHCVDNNADLVVIRTRPGNAFAPLESGISPANDDQRRAFFNNMLDAQLEQVKRDYPQLRVMVIEPKELERQNGAHLLKPELCFQPQDLEKRRVAGYEAAREVMARNPDIFPAVRKPPSPPAGPSNRLLAAAAG